MESDINKNPFNFNGKFVSNDNDVKKVEKGSRLKKLKDNNKGFENQFFRIDFSNYQLIICDEFSKKEKKCNLQLNKYKFFFKII